MSEHAKPFEEKMKKSVAALDSELSTIRVGRANPHVLDRLTVDYYGTQTPIAQIGNITVPEARLLQIQPWETAMIKAVEKAIQASDIGINPTTDGKVVRLLFPELTEDRRKEISKEVKKKGEDAKIAVRNIRRDAVDTFKKLQKDAKVSEDGLKDLEDEIQKLTDKKIEEVEKMVEAKNKEVMTV